MPLRAPPIKSPPYLVCDWAELRVLAATNLQFRLNTLRRLWDISRETEATDPEGLERREDDTDVEAIAGADEDRFFDSIVGEVEERIRGLGASYPFKLEGGSRLVLVGPPTDGGFMYLFCLFLTYANGRELLDQWRPAVDHSVRDLFQACSTLAAAGEVRGCAISFGWPRPNGNAPFLQRLQQVYALFGEGTVVATPKPGVSPAVKDEEIDIIAWRPRADRAAGTTYLLAQVASGDNWMSKPIAGMPIKNFHRNWFTHYPASTPTAAIFIPHAVPPADVTGTRRERMDALTIQYGTIFDRLRIPALTQEGLDFNQLGNTGIHIERVADIASIGHWVIRQIQRLQGSAA